VFLTQAALSFVAANAPWEVVHSFEAASSGLASFSLQLAGTMLVRQLRKTERNSFKRSLLLFFQSCPFKDETRDVAGRLHTWAAGDSAF